MKLREQIEGWAVARSIGANLTKEQGKFFETGYEAGALRMARWWAERWNTKDELEGSHALTLTEQQRLYPALREMDEATREILGDEK